MREVSIGVKDSAQAAEILRGMLADVEGGHEPALRVKGNGGPDLELRITFEDDPEWPDEPLVDYHGQ